MALEMVIGAGTIPVETYTAHEALPGTFPVINDHLVVRTNRFHVHANWTTQGAIFGIINPAYHWHGTVIFEAMGGTEYGGTFSQSVPIPIPLSNPQSYSMLINIPASSVPAGIYRVILKLDLHSPTHLAPAVCGFEDLGLFEFYDI